MSQHCTKNGFPTYNAAMNYIKRTYSKNSKSSGYPREPKLCPRCGWYHISYPQGEGHPNTRVKEAVH